MLAKPTKSYLYFITCLSEYIDVYISDLSKWTTPEAVICMSDNTALYYFSINLTLKMSTA